VVQIDGCGRCETLSSSVLLLLLPLIADRGGEKSCWAARKFDRREFVSSRFDLSAPGSLIIEGPPVIILLVSNCISSRSANTSSEMDLLTRLKVLFLPFLKGRK
jgi:hypothetical protein